MGIERCLFLSEFDIVFLSYHIATVSLYCMICLQLLGTVFDTWPDYVTQKADDIEQMEEEMRNLGAEPIIIYDVVSDSESDTQSD